MAVTSSFHMTRIIYSDRSPAKQRGVGGSDCWAASVPTAWTDGAVRLVAAKFVGHLELFDERLVDALHVLSSVLSEALTSVVKAAGQLRQVIDASGRVFEAAGNVSGTLAVVFRGAANVFETVRSVSITAKNASGPSGKAGGPSCNSDGAPKNSGGRPEKENTRQIFPFSLSAGSGLRHFSLILPLVPAGLREKTVIPPPAAPGMRHAGLGLRHISRKMPLAGLKMPLAGPGLRRNSL